MGRPLPLLLFPNSESGAKAKENYEEPDPRNLRVKSNEHRMESPAFSPVIKANPLNAFVSMIHAAPDLLNPTLPGPFRGRFMVIEIFWVPDRELA